MNTLAAGVSTAVVVAVWLARTLFPEPDEERMYDWLVRLRNAGPVVRGSVQGMMLAVVWVSFYHSLVGVIIPGLAGGLLSALGTAVYVFVGIGLGLSIGRHLTREDFSAFGGLRR